MRSGTAVLRDSAVSFDDRTCFRAGGLFLRSEGTLIKEKHSKQNVRQWSLYATHSVCADELRIPLHEIHSDISAMLRAMQYIVVIQLAEFHMLRRFSYQTVVWNSTGWSLVASHTNHPHNSWRCRLCRVSANPRISGPRQ